MQELVAVGVSHGERMPRRRWRVKSRRKPPRAVVQERGASNFGRQGTVPEVEYRLFTVNTAVPRVRPDIRNLAARAAVPDSSLWAPPAVSVGCNMAGWRPLRINDRGGTLPLPAAPG